MLLFKIVRAIPLQAKCYKHLAIRSDIAFEPRLPLMSKIVASSLFPSRWPSFSYRMLRMVQAQGLTVYLTSKPLRRAAS